MASSKVMSSSTTSRNSDLRRSSSSASSKSLSISELQNQNNRSNHQRPHKYKSDNLGSMTVDGLLRNVYGDRRGAENTLLDAKISLLDAAGAVTAIGDNDGGGGGRVAISRQESSVSSATARKTVDDVWKEIVAGRRECKQEVPDELMTLEDFLVKAGAVEVEDVKVEPPPPPAERLSGGVFAFDPMPLSPFQSQRSIDGVVGFGSGVEVVGGKGKRRAVLESLDKAAEQRQRRMIKNRESAARSRERKQAYQVELESLAVKLEEENEKLLKEKAERTRGRFKQLMEKVVPVVEKRRPQRVLRRVHSMQW